MKVEPLTKEIPPHLLREVRLEPWAESEQAALMAALEAHHYLGAPDPRQCLLGQVAKLGEQAVGILVWTHAARTLRAREQFVGWDARTRQKRLGYVVQNNRFLVLSEVRQPNLASRILGLAAQALPAQWEEGFGIRPMLAESFVDVERYAGTCYKAAGWIEVGETSGRGHNDYYQDHLQPKALWLKELAAGVLPRLRDPLQPLAGEQRRAPGALPVSAKLAESLAEAMGRVSDPRKRREFPLRAMLTAVVLALACGARTVSDIFRFVQDLRPAQRRALGFRSYPPAGRCPPPGEGCWRDVLRRVPRQSIAEVFLAWRLQQGHVPALLAFDGKTLDDGLVTLVSLVDPRDGTALAQAACPGKGHENRLAHEILGAIPVGTLDAKMLVGDALYADRTLLREIVQDHGAVGLVQLKNNQPNAVDRSDALLAQIDPPFST
jgi:hypothetical protein